jgi:adenosylhomocysteinase
MDDGADLVSTLHTTRREAWPTCTAAPKRPPPASSALRALQASGKLEYPIVAVNDANTKHFFDNRYGTGQSTIDGV